MKKTLLLAAVLSAFVLLFTGCANSSGGGNSDSGKEKGSEGSGGGSSQPVNVVSSNIGVDGGEVGDENASISIPEGALDSDTTITVKYLSNKEDVSDGPMFGFAGAVEFGPSGTKFKKTAEVMIKLTEISENETISIFCYDEEEKKWKYETSADVFEGYAIFEVSHFSKYRMVDLSPAVYEKYFEIVLNAVSNNDSDSSITDAYKNYLVNTLDMMNRYAEWGGQLYKVCGIWFSGDYTVDGKEGNTGDLICYYGDTSDEGHAINGSLTTDNFKVVDETESQKIITIYLSVYFKPVDTRNIKGHISEEFEWDFDIYTKDWSYSGPNSSSGKTTAKQKGKEKINVEYDYSGFIFIEDDQVNGSITFENIKTKVVDEKASKTIHVIDYDGKGNPYENSDRIITMSLFDKIDVCSHKLTCNVKGTCNNGICELTYDCKNRNLVTIDGDWFFEGEIIGAGFDEIINSSSACTTMRIRVGGDNIPLFSFSVDPELYGEQQESEDDELKDDFDFVVGLISYVLDYYEANPDACPDLPEWIRRNSNDDFDFDPDIKLEGDVTSSKTTQTITVVKPVK